MPADSIDKPLSRLSVTGTVPIADALDPEQLKTPLLKPADVRLAALNLLARREHLRAELQRKLSKRFRDKELATAGTPLEQPLEQVLEKLLDQLVAEGLLSEERFVESYIRQRGDKGYGPDRIEQELRQKGASGELASRGLESCEIDWSAVAERVREKKFGLDAPADLKAKSRQLRFLNYRGFSGEYAALALGES